MSKKRILVTLLVFCLALTMFSVPVLGAATSTQAVKTAKELTAALSNSAVKSITISKDLTVESSVTLSKGKKLLIKKGGALTLAGKSPESEIKAMNKGTIQVQKGGKLILQNVEFTNSKTGKVLLYGELSAPVSTVSNKGTITINALLNLFPSSTFSNDGTLAFGKKSKTVVQWGGLLKNNKTVKPKKGAQLHHFSSLEGFKISDSLGIYHFDGKKWKYDGFVERSVEEKVQILNALNGGEYSASNENITTAEVIELLISAFGLEESYVKADGDTNMESIDSAFFDFGGGGEKMSFMRINLPYLIVKVFHLSSDPIDSTDAWQHIGQTGYTDVDNNEWGYPGSKEALYLCKKLGIELPSDSKTEFGDDKPVTKAEFVAALYSAYRYGTP